MKKLFLFCGTIFLLSVSYAHLIISEVYFDGSDEWVEIYNDSGVNFSGTISLSGVKSSLLTIDDFFLSEYGITLLGDNLDSIIDTQYAFQSGAGLSIADTQAIDISLYSGIELLDNFFVDQTNVQTINNQSTSFQRIGENIFSTTSEYVFNNQTGFFINPGKIFTGNIQDPEDPQEQNSSYFDIRITEVYFDGYGEWIELSNIGTGDFQDELMLMIDDKWIKLGTITIENGSSIVLGEEGKDYSYFIDQSFITNLYSSLSLLDTQPIQVKLLHQGRLIDTFYIAKEYVQQANSTSKQSFEKIRNEDNLLITFSDITRQSNVSENYIANPGSISTTTGTFTDLDNFDYNTDFSYLTLPINCNEINSSVLRVNEVFFGDENISSYIEIEGIEDFFGTITLSGSLLHQSTALDIDTQSDQVLVIAASENGLLSTPDKVLNPSLELNSNGGRLTISGQTGQLLDIIYVVSTEGSKSVYFDGIYQQCSRIFNHTGWYSPGFDESFLSYFPQGVPIIQEKVVYVGGGGGGSCPACPDVDTRCPIEQEKTIAIKHIEYAPQEGEESIMLQSFLDEDIDFSKKKYYLQVKGQTSKKYIYDVLQENQTQTFFKNFRFSNTNETCVELYYEQDVLDEYCYNPKNDVIARSDQGNDEAILIDDTIGIISNTSTGLPIGQTGSVGQYVGSGEQQEEVIKLAGQVDTTRPSVIKIQNIIFNPPGKDAGNETITFKIITGAQVDLSTFRLAIRTRTKTIEGILTDELTIKGNFGFPNTKKEGEEKICVSLVQDNNIYDTYCYDPLIDLAVPGTYTVSSILDGDTFRIKVNGKTQSVRLLGIDTPESFKTRFGYIECRGKEAKAYLKTLIDDKEVRLDFDTKNTRVDAYGRRLAYVYLDDIFVNEQLIREGYAREYTFKELYDHVSLFKKAEQDAKNNQKGLRDSQACNGERKSTDAISNDEEDLDVQEIDYTQYIIKIQSVEYDPPGSDLYNEKITLKRIDGEGQLDLDAFRLRVGTSNRRIQGMLQPNEEQTFVGNFRFPNSRAECVSLVYEDHIFDTICYTPEGIKEEDIEKDVISSGANETSEIEKSLFTKNEIKITSLVPNPLGSDTGKEKITLRSNLGIDLTQGYYLKAGAKKTYFKKGILQSNQEQTLIGTFGLTNKATCVTLEKENYVFDTFCYPKASDGDKFTRSNGVIQTLSDIDLKILNSAKLAEYNNSLCITYQGLLFNCKKQTMSSKDKNEFNATQKRISTLKNYLRNNWQMLYYNTDMENYFALFDQQQELIDQGQENIYIGGQEISIYDLNTRFALLYKKPYVQKLTDRIETEIKSTIVVKQYLKWRDEYFTLLSQKGI